MKKQIIVSSLLAAVTLLTVAGTALAAIIPPPPPTEPTTVDQCKHDGWRDYGDMFKNQGDCVSFVVTDGRNAPDGPPVH